MVYIFNFSPISLWNQSNQLVFSFIPSQFSLTVVVAYVLTQGIRSWPAPVLRTLTTGGAQDATGFPPLWYWLTVLLWTGHPTYASLRKHKSYPYLCPYNPRLLYNSSTNIKMSWQQWLNVHILALSRQEWIQAKGKGEEMKHKAVDKQQTFEGLPYSSKHL